MAKRVKVGSELLTGGTGDVNPQFMSGVLTLSAANTTTEVTLGTPIVRVGPQTGGQAIIMEVLKIYVDLPRVDADNATPAARLIELNFSTVANGTAIATWDNPRLFARVLKNQRNAFTAAGTGLLAIDEMFVMDLTDGAGHGILIATDNIFVQGDTSSQAAASVFAWKILYRFKKVSLIEYIGIVQSQQ